ncbi:MAG: toxin-antitoxin system YwqK family antitoxin [Ginsengibacter sp.]
MKFFLILFCTLILSCKNDSYINKKIGNYVVKAKFIHDTLIDGEATYYNLDGKIVAKANYLMGKLNGDSITYYDNSKIQDSIKYSNGLLDCHAYQFDSTGYLQSIRTFYYGLAVGEAIDFYKGKIYEYSFTDFDKKELINCKYNSKGSCKYFFFNPKPLLKNVYSATNDSAINFFLYFPHPPDFDITYNFKLINSKTNEESKIFLNSNRLFIDTILTTPKNGYKYFLSIDYKNISTDSTINVVSQNF